MQRRWTFRDRFGREVVAMPRAAASPDELSRAMDPREASRFLDDLFRDGEGRGLAHGRLLQAIADVPGSDARLYSRADLKARIIKRVGRRAAFIVARGTSRRIGAPIIAEAVAVERKAKGATTKPEVFTFVWDAPFSQRQWVNLPGSWGAVGVGREATLVGHVEPRAAGQTVTFALSADPSNPPEAVGAALRASSAVSDADGTVHVKVVFPLSGGARIKVRGMTQFMAAPAMTKTITVWRKVFYQVTEMGAAPDGTRFHPPPGMIAALQRAFDPVFIELGPGTKMTATTPYRPHLTAAERRAIETALSGSSVDDKSPFKLNIVMIDAADIVAEQEEQKVTDGARTETKPFIKWRHEPTVIRAEFENITGVWLPLENVAVVDLPDGYAKVTGEVPGPLAAFVRVRIKYRFQRGFAGGWGGQEGTIFMCIGWKRRSSPSAPGAADLQQALTHEIGHALGLLSPAAPWHDPDPRDSGYSLRHCGHKTSASEPRCVMWYMLGGSGDRLRFCKSNAPDDCAYFLLRADLSQLKWI